jgi:hypothetical protein
MLGPEPGLEPKLEPWFAAGTGVSEGSSCMRVRQAVRQVNRLSGPVAGGGGQAAQDFQVAAAGVEKGEQQGRRTLGPCF